jgi:hypothetical protein
LALGPNGRTILVPRGKENWKTLVQTIYIFYVLYENNGMKPKEIHRIL